MTRPARPECQPDRLPGGITADSGRRWTCCEPPPGPEAIAREQFPALRESPAITYLDSAATTQKPQRVIDAVTAELARSANPGRGSYPWSTRAARLIEQAREQVAGFIGAAHADEIVFTSGATAGLNAVALSWGLANLADGDEILYSPLAHSSNVYPWVRLAQILARFGRRVRLVPYPLTAAGSADIGQLLGLVSPRTRLITVTHVHNLFGTMTTLAEAAGQLGPAVRLCFDCSQSAGHVPVDVGWLRADFAVFAAHKMFGPPGAGVLYVSRRVHGELAPFLPGGGTAVRLAAGALAELAMPAGLEGGTPDVPGIAGLAAAIDFIGEVGIGRIAAHSRQLTGHLAGRLREVPGLKLLPGPDPDAPWPSSGIAAFRVTGVRSDDLGFALSSGGFCIRTGRHCLAEADGYDDSARVSVHLYNSAAEIDRFVDFLTLVTEGAS